MMDIQQVISELQDEFAKGKNVFWSKKSLVNLQRCEELIDELKRVLPSSLQEATYIISQKNKILSQAEEVAAKTIAEAEKHAEMLVSESELVKRTEQEVDAIQEKSKKQCNAMYVNTKDNIDRLLKSIEDYLMDNLHVVRNNREELAGVLLNKKKKDED